ncbi:MAG: ABC transporter substrate-binding protein [Candidatus Methanomethylophilaceae archaeon]|nr:ABC transporter substrate-binding protein [Candidatus Methanomethylophilaceae archaeon]
MDKKVIALIAIIAVVAVAAVAVFAVMSGNNDDKPAAEKDTLKVTDMAGNEVQLKVPLERVVCGDAGLMTLIASIAGKNYGNILVGYDSNLREMYPDFMDMWTDAGMDFSKITPVGSFLDSSFNWETVASLKPDAVFVPYWCITYGMVTQESIDNMAKAGIPIVTLDLFSAKLNADEMARNCEVRGKIFDNERTASDVAKFYRSQVEKVSSKISQVPADKYTYYIETITNLGQYCLNYSTDDGKPQEALNQKSLTKYGETVGAEAFASSDVDFIFLDLLRAYYPDVGKYIGWGAKAPAESELASLASALDKRVGWSASIPAIDNNEVYFINKMSMSGTIDGWWIQQFYAEKMFPEIFGDLGYMEALGDFYKTYLPWVDFRGVWYFGLNGEVGATPVSESRDKETTVTITDLAGREVKISAPVERVVCGDAEAMSLIAAIAGEDFKDCLVGYDSNLQTYYPDLARMWENAGIDFSKIASVGSFQNTTFSWEAVASLDPDVVFVPMWVYQYGMVSEDTAKKMADAGIPIVNLDLFVSSYDADTMSKNCDIIGKIFDRRGVASKVADFYAEQLDSVLGKKSQIPEGKLSFYEEMLVKLDSYRGGANVAEVLALGQQNIATPGQQISAEAFVSSDPDHVFFMAYNGAAECGKNIGWGATVTASDIANISASLSKRPGWDSVTAVKNKDVMVYDQVYFNTFENWMILQLHAMQMFPDTFSSLDPVGSLESFYEEFLPWVELKGVWYFTLDGDIGETQTSGGGSVGKTVTVTDLAGREVALDIPLKRVVCGDAESMTLIAAIAGEQFADIVVGYDSNLNSFYPDLKEMWTSAGMDFGRMTEVGSFLQGTFNWETVASLNPDAVFMPTWCIQYGMVSQETVDKMAKAGIPIVTLDLFVGKLNPETMSKNCDIVGRIFDNQATAAKVAGFYKTQVEKVSSRLSQVPAEKYTYYVELVTYLSQYSQNESDNPIECLNQKSLTQYKQTVSPEVFATSDVDFVFFDLLRSYAPECGKFIGWGASVTKSDIDSIAAKLGTRIGWNESVPAISSGNVYFIDKMSMIGMFDCWFVYQFMAETMFPEIYGDLDCLETLDGYYSEYLPWVDFKGVWYFSIDGEVGATS